MLARILKILAVILLVLAVVGAGFYYFGSLRTIQTSTVTASDGSKVEFTIRDGWCAVKPSMLGLANFSDNTVFVKRGNCKVRALSHDIKLAELLQIRVHTVAESAQEQQIIALCAQSAGGLSGYQKEGAIYCLGAPEEGARGISVFRPLDNKYMVTTSMFLLDAEDRELQLKDLEGLVRSYKVRQ